MAHGAGRQAELERAMRAHPAGSALRRRPAPGADRDRSGGGPPRTPLRLTARGRRLSAVLGLAAGVGMAAAVAGAVGGGGSGALHLAGQSSVVVRPGDTLWSIASSVAGEQDVRAVVDRIREVNGLHSGDLVPGQVLRLP
jgi:nucleoid-associated protein YgaU